MTLTFSIIAWIKLRLLEYKLLPHFGKHNKYRHFCLKRDAKTAAQRLAVAREVLEGSGVNSLEACLHALVLKQHGIRL